MCIFCKIVNGEIPAYKVYEDDQILAFLDISAVTKGHTLVIPKKHYDNFFDINCETLMYLMKTAKEITHKLQKTLNFTDMNIVNNCGALAGQSVNHFHLHLIPIYQQNQAVVVFKTKDQTKLDNVIEQINE